MVWAEQLRLFSSDSRIPMATSEYDTHQWRNSESLGQPLFQSGHHSERGGVPWLEKVRVFLVDDHPVVREGIRRLLSMDERIQVVGQADSGEQALEQIAKASVKVVLMDVMLPGMDGIEATERLTAQDPELSVVILSSFGDRYLTRSIEAGACGYILKTATQSEMVSAVLRAADGQSPIDPKLTGLFWNRHPQAFTGRARRPRLSGRQRRMLQLIADGVPSKQIAETLSVSGATLTRELRRIFDLLGVDDRAHAIAEAYREKLL